MLLYGDNLDGSPTVNHPGINAGVALPPFDVQNWLGGLVIFERSGGSTGDYRSGSGVWVSAGKPDNSFPNLTSEACLHFTAGAFMREGKNASYCALRVPAQNVGGKHFVGGLFAYNIEGGSLDFPIVGWNGGLSAPTSDILTYYEATAVVVNVDGNITVGEEVGETTLVRRTNYYIEVEIDPIEGKVSVWVNGHPELSGVSVSGLNEVMQVGWMIGNRPQIPSGEHIIYSLDNIYILDDTGDSFNSRLGPIKVKRLPLISEDNISWTPDGAATNLDAVNKTTLNTNTFNISPSANGESDTYKVDTSGLDEEATILGVMVNTFAAKDDVGDRNLDQIAITDNQTTRQDFGPHLSPTYNGADFFVMPKAPDGSAWDIDTIDNTVFGYEVKE